MEGTRTSAKYAITEVHLYRYIDYYSFKNLMKFELLKENYLITNTATKIMAM